MAKNEKAQTEEKKVPAMIAYHVSGAEKAHWTRIGAAWDHKDGEGYTLQLDLLPMTKGRIVLRKYEPKDDGETE